MLNRNMKYTLLTALALIPLMVADAYAYTDPGSAGAFYQLVVLAIGVVAGYFAVFRRHIKNFFAGRGKDSEKDK